MVIQQPSKCSNCGSTVFDYIQPNNATSFVLTTIDQTQTPPAFNPGSGLPVHAYKCAGCGSVTLHLPLR